MRYQDKRESVEANEAAQPPSQCPVCRSSNVTTASKVVSAASYWRCGACGEVWNVGRQKVAGRYSGRGFSR